MSIPYKQTKLIRNRTGRANEEQSLIVFYCNVGVGFIDFFTIKIQIQR